MRTLKNTIPQACIRGFVSSPFGDLGVVISESGVRSIDWPNASESSDACEPNVENEAVVRNPIHAQLAQQLREYFTGARRNFEVPLDLAGTPFQNTVWNSLQTIPYGLTISYEEQAIRVGGRQKVRAVGQAIGRNPLPILIPCHRVIGKNGSLTGFGGGLAIKQFLLNLESARP